MMRALAFLIAILGTASAATAHDFWIQPARWQWTAPGNMPATFEVGHGAQRQRSPIAASRIQRFDATAADGGRTELRDRLTMGAATGDATIALDRPGLHVVALETDYRAESHLPAARFNDYLAVEGLTPAIALRARQHRTDADGAENYGRHAKALVQIGPPSAADLAMAARPVGLALEIVPERSPYVQPRAATLPVRVDYHGRALAGALVKLTDLAHDAEPVEMHRTDEHGRAIFAMPAGGNWLLNVIWTRPQPASSPADFETSFSSLSFGFDE